MTNGGRHQCNNLVSRDMSLLVVDRLEMVNIEEDDRHRLRAAIRAPHQLGDMPIVVVMAMDVLQFKRFTGG